MLTEEKKARLLELINEAEANGESPDFIQNQLIPAFKSRHESAEPAAPAVEQNRRGGATRSFDAEPIWSRETGEVVPENIAPYYKQGIENITKRPMQTLFPGASSVEGNGIVPEVKRNALGALDMLNWPDRAVDYASGGAFERGRETIGEAINKIPGKGKIPELVRGNLKTGVDIATSPSTYVGLKTIGQAFSRETPEKIATAMAKKTGVEGYIKKGVDKGIKPTVRNKSNFSAMKTFEQKADEAVKTIAQHKNEIRLVDEFGEAIQHPRSAAEFAQAIEQTKRSIYKQYHRMATEAGDAGAAFDFNPISSKLDAVSVDLKKNPQIRKYALELKEELAEIQGATPEVIEERIKDLNSSLNGFYDGRVTKAKAQVDASVANLMREELDKKITSAVGEGYQALKNKYGALKAIEKEVNHRAIVNARKASKGMADLTDIFTGGDLIGGVLTLNPAMMARGVAGRGIKEIYKSLNNPDRYINDMFKKAYRDYSPPAPKPFQGTIPKKSMLSNERGSIGGAAGRQAPAPETIQAIVDAAERHGGLQNIDMVGTRRSFGESVSDGYLWYNTPDKSTRVVPIRKNPLSNQRGSIGDAGKNIASEFKDAGTDVSGLYVRKEIPNMSSIDATLTDYKILPGIKEVPMSEFELTGKTYSKYGNDRIRHLADQIKESGEINPLIVVKDKEGYYILEGSTRADALYLLGKKTIPAKVVIDKESIGNIFNQKGSIGGMAEKYIGTPAIRDPQTGKIYKGGYRGHKDAIVKGETSAVQERLKWEHFLDNTNKPTDNVGFIDKGGNFITRSEAERKLASSSSLAQQFHTVGIAAGTAAAAGGGLTIGAAAQAAKNKKKRKR